MILIGRDLSPFVRRVAVAMKTLGLPFARRELSTVDDKDTIKALNPLGRVPALILENDEALIESAAILDHLDEMVGPAKALLPLKGEQRRETLRLVALATGVMDKGVATLYERIKRPAEKIHQPWQEHLEQQIEGGLTALDAATKGKSFLVGNRISHADIAAAVAWDFLAYCCPRLRDAGRFANLAAFAAKMTSLPAFQETSIAKYLS